MALVDPNRIKASVAENKVVNRPGGIMQPKFNLSKVEKPSVFSFDYWREEKAPLLAAWMKMDPKEQYRPDPGLIFGNLAPFKPMEDLFPRTSVGFPKDEPKAITTYAPEGGNLVGRFNGQRGYVGTDTSSAVADALIGNSVVAPVVAPVVVPTLTPAEQTKVDKALRAGLMARATKQGSMLDGADKIDRDFFAMRPEGSNAKRIENTPLLISTFEDIATAENPDTGAMVHLDSENIITLWNGVVPTGGLTYRGRSIPAKDHGLTEAQIEAGVLSEIDYSNAVSQGINRSRYKDGKDGYDQWSKAVFTVYADQVREQAGLQSTENNTNALVNNDVAFDDLPDGAKKMLYDVGWNGGPGSVKWSGVSTSAYEASKPIEDQTTDNLIAITKHFGTGESARGVLKRRAMEYNNIAKPGEIATNINTTPWNDAKGNRKGTTYAIQTANGTTLKTYNKPDLTPILGDLEVPQGG